MGKKDVATGKSFVNKLLLLQNDLEIFCLRWIDISNVINHKRDFTIESVVGSDKAEFQFSDVESAKNAWRLCVLQHMFYKQYEANGGGEQVENHSPVVQKSQFEVSVLIYRKS